MADRYLLESGSPDGYLLEDGSGVELLEVPPTLPTATGTQASGTSLSITIPLPALGDTIVMLEGDTGGGVSAMSGGGVTTWHNAIAGGFNEAFAVWWGLVDGTPSTSVTLTLPTGRIACRIVELPGAWTFDQKATESSGSTPNTTPTQVDSGFITPTSDGQLLLAMGFSGFSVLLTGPLGMIDLGHVAQGTGDLGVGYAIQATAQRVTTSWQAPSGSAWDSTIVSFKPPVFVPKPRSQAIIVA